MRGLMQVFLLWHRKNDWFQIIQKYFLQFFIFIKFIYHIKTSYTLIRHLKLGSLTIWFMLPIIVMGLMWNNLFFAELDVLRWFFIDTWEVFIKEPMPLTARSQTRYATVGWNQFWSSIHYFKIISMSSLSRGSVPSSYARGQQFEPRCRQYLKLLLDPGDLSLKPLRITVLQ